MNDLDDLVSFLIGLAAMYAGQGDFSSANKLTKWAEQVKGMQ